MALKNQIVRANLRLVVSIAKRHVGQGDNFFELVSDGNMSLIRAVEKFDFARGNKFSTYASWAIMKNFARTIPDEHRHRDRFRTSHSEMFASDRGAADAISTSRKRAQAQRESQIGKILERLDEREQKIIISRFGLDHGHEPLTLEGSRRRDGRHQGTDPADRGPGSEQAAGRGPGREDRSCRARVTGPPAAGTSMD